MTASIKIPEHLARLHGVAAEGVSRSLSADQLGKNWVSRFKRYTGINGSSRILDIGCGAGRMAIAIGDEFGFTNDYTGFDVDAEQVAFCSENITSVHPNFKFIHANLDNPLYNPKGSSSPSRFAFPASSSSIDFCFATSVFTHMFTDDVAHYIKEAHRVLRPGGAFLSTWFCIDGRSQDLSKNPRFVFSYQRSYLGGWINKGDLVAYKDNPAKAVAYPLRKARRLLSAAGFKNVVFHKGSWSGADGADHSQDVIVATR